MPGTPLAEAFVRVRADVSKFKDDVRDAFRGVGDEFGRQFGDEATARMRADHDRFAKAGTDLGADAGDAAGDEFGRHMAEEGAVQFGNDGAPFVKVGEKVGDDAGKAAGKKFGERLSEGGTDAVKQDRDKLVSESEKTGEDSGDGFRKGFDHKAGGDGNNRGRRAGKDYGDGFADGLGGGLARVGDVGKRALDALTPGLSKLASGLGAATTAAGGLLATITKWGALTAGVLALGAAAASAAGYTVQLAAAIAPVGGLLAGLPGLLLTGAAAMTTWKLATYGVGEAMAAVFSGDDKALGAAMGKLTDSARAFISEFQKVLPALKDVQAVAQQGFFDQLTGGLDGFVSGIGGLRDSIGGLASDLGGVVRAVLEFVSSADTVSKLNTIFGGTRDLIGAIRDSLQPLLTGFTDLGVVGNGWLAGFSGNLQNVLTRFGEWMSKIASSGQAMAWLDSATVVLKQLSTLTKDLWDILVGLLRAANDAGSTTLGVLGKLVGAFSDWVNSAKGQDVLVTIFKALSDIGTALVPIIKSLGGAVAAVAPVAAQLATALGPILAGAIDALGPAIAAVGPGLLAMVKGIGDGFKSLEPVLKPLGKVLGSVFAELGGALAAILPQLGKIALALGPVLADAVKALGPALAAIGPGLVKGLEGVGKAVDAIGPLLKPLGGEIGKIIAELGGALALILPQVAKIAIELAPALASAIKALGPALAALGPGLIAVAQNLAKAFASPEMQRGLLALGKGISDVLIAAAPLLPVIAQLAGLLVQLLGGALSNLGVLLGPIIKALGTALEPALRAISDALNLLMPLMPPIYKAFGDIGAALITQLLPPVLNLIPALINNLIPAFADFARQIEPLIPLLADLAVKFIRDVLPSILPVLPELTNLAVQLGKVGIVLAQLVVDVAPQIERLIAAFQHLYDTLVGHSIIPDLINEMTAWFRNGVQWIKDAVAWFGELPTLIGGWLGSVLSKVSEIWGSIKTTVTTKIGEMRDSVSDVLGAIKAKWSEIWNSVGDYINGKINDIKGFVGRLGDLPGQVSNWFGQVKDGIVNKWNEAVSFVQGIPGRITGALGNLGNLLYNSGTSIVQGMWNGIVNKWNEVIGQWNSMVNGLVDNVKRILGIASPSKVFAELGKQLPAGLAAGMDGQRGMVAAAAQRLSDAAAVFAPPLTLAGPTGAGAFTGQFGTASPPGGGAFAAGGGVTIQGDLVIPVQGILDPSDPASFRRMARQIRGAIIDLEKEGYARV